MKLKALTFFVPVLFLTACNTIAEQIVKEPQVALSRVNLRNVTSEGATIMFGVEVDNPNPFSLKLDALKYDVELGGKAFTSGKIDQAAQVAGNAKAIVDIPVAVKFADLYSSITDLISSGTKPYRVKGEAVFGLFTIPFDKTGELKIKQ